MKKIFIGAILVLAIILAGCTVKVNDTTEPNDSSEIKVITTNFPAYDFVRYVGGERVEVDMLVPPGAETHSFEPTAQDIINIQNSDVFVYIGGESEEWVESILETAVEANPAIEVVCMMDLVELKEEEIVEGMEEEDEEEEGIAYDEHVWTVPSNVINIEFKIADVLCALDPDGDEYYRTNANEFESELLSLEYAFEAQMVGAKRNTIIVADRFPLRYFADRFGLEYYAAFPGCSTETEASAATVAFLIDKVTEESIPVVFKIELSNGKMAEAISEATGAKVLTFHSCHNVTKEDFDNGVTYLDIMYDNIDAFREALY
jgi:zinc transport system substrate-binding protein